MRLYGSLIKSHVDAFDSILVLDIESFNQGDDEYDRRMTFFCMSISHVIILNASTDISDRFIDMLALCNNSLKRVFGNRSQSSIIHLVLNQTHLSDTITSNETRKRY